MCVPCILNASRFEFDRSTKLNVCARRSLGCLFSTSPGDKDTRTNVAVLPSPLAREAQRRVLDRDCHGELNCIYQKHGINTTLIKNL
jgi:hypothetical protein